MELARWSIGRDGPLGPFDPSRVCGQRTRAITHTRTLRAMRVAWKNARAAALALSLASRVVRILLFTYRTS